MLITISTTHTPATDLGFLLKKNPNRSQSFDLAFGKAHIFYPEATIERCTAALFVEVDPIGLVRRSGSGGADSFGLYEYVNDRPYVASSFLSVAIGKVFGSALSAKGSDGTDLANLAIPLEIQIPVVPCRGGERFLKSLFEPLGYEIGAARFPLDEQFPEWGDSLYFSVNLKGTFRLSEVLTHLYVLLPVLDDEKHYWVGDDEVEKLIRKGEGWLETHPQREAIALRYLKHRRSLAQAALERLLPDDVEEQQVASTQAPNKETEEVLEEKLSLNEQRLRTVFNVVKEAGARQVVDLGCGEGKLLRELLRDKQFDRIIGMDVSTKSLEHAKDRLQLDKLRPKDAERISLIQGSLMYRDKRLAGFPAATVVEVIEHLDAPRLAAFERVVFEFARPELVVVTTPNSEYNVLFENLPAGKFRHKDHRFEWTREEFRTWATNVASRYGYAVEFKPVGEEHSLHGSPTQMGVFRV